MLENYVGISHHLKTYVITTQNSRECHQTLIMAILVSFFSAVFHVVFKFISPPSNGLFSLIEP